MKKTLFLFFAFLLCFAFVSCKSGGNNTSYINVSDTESQVLPENIIGRNQIKDKILGSWVGQMTGVVYGADIKYHYRGEIMPEEEIADFETFNINNAFWQDNFYVELTFLKALSDNGIDCSLEQLGEAFAATDYPLDHANLSARDNLQNGISPQMSGHYTNNLHCDDRDWQIESDFLGLVYGGDVQTAANRSYELGHMICYGDGVYGGVFVSALTAAAFNSQDIYEVVDQALSVIPDSTEFKTVLQAVFAQYNQGKTWQECWQYIQDKWGDADRCITSGPMRGNFDAKLNSAYVLMGLLYGEGDFENSITITLRCGQDNDCNASTVGGVLGTMLGYDNIPEKYKKDIDLTGTYFSYTWYNLESIVNSTFDLFTSRLSEYAVNKWLLNEIQELTPVAYEQWEQAPSVIFDAEVEKNTVKVSANYYSVNGIASAELDFGDGFVTHENVAGYKFSSPGKHTITLTVTDSKGNSTVLSRTVTVTETLKTDPSLVGTYRNIALYSVPVCSDTAPKGEGYKNIYIINNSAAGVNATTQYDTYVGYMNKHNDYVGYLFTEACTVDTIVFTEGMHFDNGGWFDGGITVQALVNGVWTDIQSKINPKYPTGNTKADFGADFESYTFTFDEISCNGIRIIGTAGGSAGYISVSELEVYGTETAYVE